MIDRTAMSLAAVAAMILGASSGVSAAWSFADGEFLQADWSHSIYADQAQGHIAALHQPDGGNDGRYLSYEFTSNLGHRVQIASFNTANVYDPSVDGAIADLGFSFTTRQLMGDADSLSAWLAIEQNGALYISFVGGLEYDGSNWMLVNGDGLTADDFVEYDPPSGDFFPMDHPDFSVNGAAMRFGLFDLQGNFDQGPQQLVRIDDYDNFSIRIQNIPAPGAAALLSLAGLSSLRRRPSRSAPQPGESTGRRYSFTRR